MKPASSEPLIAKVYLQIARLDAFQPGFFAFHRLIGQNSIIAKLFPNCVHLSHVQTRTRNGWQGAICRCRCPKPILLAWPHAGYIQSEVC